MKKVITVILAVLVVSIMAFTNTAFADYYSDNITLYPGMQNNEVLNLQNDLKDLGYFNGYIPTGYFGDNTEQAVIAYQQENNLLVDGVVGCQTSRQIKVGKVLQTARSYMGVPYVWGGVSPTGFDCSGFTHYTLLHNGIIIPRTAEQQYNLGTWVPRSRMMPGDFVFFSTYKPGPSHVGIYLGNNRFINASSSWGKIVIADLNISYFTQHYLGAKRIIQ